MRRLRDAIIGLFNDIISQPDLLDQGIITRRTRVNGLKYGTDKIPFTGGLRIHAAEQVILVDAGRGGGLAHLLHCWQVMSQDSGKDIPRITMFYIFIAKTSHAREMYQPLWEFLQKKVRDDLGNRLQVYFGVIDRPCLPDSHADVPKVIVEQCRTQLTEQGILGRFEQVLGEKRVVGHESFPFPSPVGIRRVDAGVKPGHAT